MQRADIDWRPSKRGARERQREPGMRAISSGPHQIPYPLLRWVAGPRGPAFRLEVGWMGLRNALSELDGYLYIDGIFGEEPDQQERGWRNKGFDDDNLTYRVH